MSVLNVIRKQLIKIVNDIDAGNSNIEDGDAEEIMALLNKYTNKDIWLSKYQSYTHLNISRATFDNLVKEGKLPKGRKQQGFKELSWNKKDLNKYIKQNK